LVLVLAQYLHLVQAQQQFFQQEQLPHLRPWLNTNQQLASKLQLIHGM
jgi:hypothetical protein